MISTLENQIHKSLNEQLHNLEEHFKADIFTYFGQFINTPKNNIFLKIVEDLVSDTNKKEKLYVILTTGGGDVHVVERFVNILRHHYKEVNFIVPDFAYSAGTVFCMSGDSILMDYCSVLGPIDPQVQNKEGKLVAALGYLDKIDELLEKARNNTLTQAEFFILKDFDLAELRGYEQARDLTIDLLEKWLVKYKFKNWKTHRTDEAKKGNPVTEDEKKERAKTIAENLNDNNKWKTHARPIDIQTLKELRLEIDDYSDDNERKSLIRNYHNMVLDYVEGRNSVFVHTRKFID